MRALRSALKRQTDVVCQFFMPPHSEDVIQIRKVLEYHVISGKVIAADAIKVDSATTAEGSIVKIDTSSNVKVNDPMVVIPDVEADNGVIDIIGTVLIHQLVSRTNLADYFKLVPSIVCQ